MSVLHITSFGSSSGFSAALPMSIEILFGGVIVYGERSTSPEARSAPTFAWIGFFEEALRKWLCPPLAALLGLLRCSFIPDKLRSSKPARFSCGQARSLLQSFLHRRTVPAFPQLAIASRQWLYGYPSDICRPNLAVNWWLFLRRRAGTYEP